MKISEMVDTSRSVALLASGSISAKEALARMEAGQGMTIAPAGMPPEHKPLDAPKLILAEMHKQGARLRGLGPDVTLATAHQKYANGPVVLSLWELHPRLQLRPEFMEAGRISHI